MHEIYLLIAIVFIGVALAVWVLLKPERPHLPAEKSSPISPSKEVLKEKPQKDAAKPKSKFSFGSLFSKKEKAPKNPPDFDIPQPTAVPSLLEQLEQERKAKKERFNLRKDPINQPPAASAPKTAPTSNISSITTGMKPLSKEEEKTIEQEIQLSAELSDLKEKYAKIEKILQEKSAELDKTQNALNIEIKNRRDFNRVKDILEKEIKDYKENVREAQSQTSQTKMESESYKKRIGILEEKVTTLEKEILAKEKEIENIKKMQPKPTPQSALKAENPIKEALAENNNAPKNDVAKEPVENAPGAPEAMIAPGQVKAEEPPAPAQVPESAVEQTPAVEAPVLEAPKAEPTTPPQSLETPKVEAPVETPAPVTSVENLPVEQIAEPAPTPVAVPEPPGEVLKETPQAPEAAPPPAAPEEKPQVKAEPPPASEQK